MWAEFSRQCGTSDCNIICIILSPYHSFYVNIIVPDEGNKRISPLYSRGWKTFTSKQARDSNRAILGQDYFSTLWYPVGNLIWFLAFSLRRITKYCLALFIILLFFFDFSGNLMIFGCWFSSHEWKTNFSPSPPWVIRMRLAIHHVSSGNLYVIAGNFFFPLVGSRCTNSTPNEFS